MAGEGARRSAFWFAALVGLSLSTASCAFVDQRVSLKYLPEGGPTPKGYGVMTLLTQVDIGVKLDTKSDGSYVIGNVKNGYGMTTADTITSDRLDDWIMAALTAELEGRGITVKRVEQLPSSFDVGARLVVTRFWVEQDAGWWTVGAITQLNLIGDLYSKGELVKKVAIEGTGDSRSVVSGTGDREQSLQKALRAVMAKLVPDILALRQ